MTVVSRVDGCAYLGMVVRQLFRVRSKVRDDVKVTGRGQRQDRS